MTLSVAATKPLDAATSREIAGEINATAQAGHLCAVFALMYLPPDTEYVEGWIVSDGGLAAHGWCETQTAIVDPLLADRAGKVYFAGARYQSEQALGLALGQELPITTRPGRIGMGQDAYWAARQAAQAVSRRVRPA